MKKGNFRRWGSMLGLLSGLWTFVPAPAARACSILLCSATSVAPSGGIIPANAPALAFVAPPNTTVTPEKNLLLTTLDGQSLPFDWEPDPTMASAFLIHPRAPLQAGAGYRLVGIGSCGTGPAAGLNAAFYVGPDAELPTSFGPVNPHDPEILDLIVPDSASCSAKRRVSSAYLEVAFPAYPVPYAQLTRGALKVDGQVWRAVGYGETLPTQPYHVCDVPDYNGLPAGHHSGELSIHVAGAVVDPPPVTFEFDLQECGPQPIDFVDGGAPIGDGGAASDGPPVVARPSSGCAIAGGPGSGWGGWSGALVLVALAAGRARRRRTRG